MDNPDLLEYKNFWLFYKILYKRLFNLIDSIIDENQFNIYKIKNNMIDFMDSYSYYLLKKKLINKEDAELEKNDILKLLSSFDSFTKEIKDFPSKRYLTILIELKTYNYDLTKLGNENYTYILREYYLFFDKILEILKNFVDVASTNGFLPNIRSKNALKSIGYANYDLFFTQLEELKLKISEITSNINVRTLFKSRRSVYCILVIFSPYFKNQEVYTQLVNTLNFEFIDDDKTLNDIKQSLNYKDIYSMPTKLKDELDNNILNDLKINISIIKRYISYEFGERDMSPTIKKKYAYDPTDT